MKNIVEFNEILNSYNELKSAFLHNFQGRSKFQLDKFVVGSQYTESRMYSQCVTELQVKYFEVKRLHIDYRRKLQKLEQLTDPLDIEEIELEIEQLELIMIGHAREFRFLYDMFKSMTPLTNEELEKAEDDYWIKRLSTQSMIDVESNGVISAGNAEALRQINILSGYTERFDNLIEKHPGINNKLLNKGD